MALPSSPRCPFRLDPEARDIHAEAELLRGAGPAARVELPGAVPAWSVTDPGLIRRLLTDPRVSKDAHRHWPRYIEGRIPADWPLRIWVDTPNALSAYGEEHTRLRRLIGAAFTARRVRALAPRIEEITAGLLDRLAAAAASIPRDEAAEPGGPVLDLREHFAWVLPLMVVNSALGVPEEAHDAFRACIGDLFNTNVPGEKAVAATAEVYRLLEELVAAKRARPGDDVTSALISAHDDETASRLSHGELLGSLLLLIGAGHETTVNLLDHAVVNLLSHPEQLALVRSGAASWSDVIEETLRHQAPIATIVMRFPTTDIHDAETGLTFRRGEALAVNYAAAGRDPGVHGAGAADFDITRETRREHLAFGHGVHFCLGAELARLEARIALPALFARFPELALAEPAEKLAPLESFISNGHRRLPVRLGTTDRAGASAG
ncbi:cytochrome P450 family protein [Streptomyces palmae]|uniref:Cytochrome P450 n=1 Tax=Streptomyces palmae TaxID=1701085 RepID=A0A4Z0H6W4_9ACTN|nr:cytochrome P450 [Streptomyces palmae]TGB08842.1 cytochrome P450 [Streptomyces palmae]